MKKLCIESDHELEHVDFYRKYGHLPNYPDYLAERLNYVQETVEEQLNKEIEVLVQDIKKKQPKKTVKKAVKKKSTKKKED